MMATLLTLFVVLAVAQATPVRPPHEAGLTNLDWDVLSKYCFTSTGTTVGHIDSVQRPPSDCQDLLNAGQVFSGTYLVYRCVMKTPIVIPVYCDMTTDGGGWTVFQRRFDGNQEFVLNWADYKSGFGDLNEEFWLGNDFLSLLTSEQPQQLRVDLEDFEDDVRYAKYSHFSVAPSHDKYRLAVSGYTGDAVDSFSYQSGSQFSTADSDNDKNSAQCAVSYPGGWWYNSCVKTLLNGEYFPYGNPSKAHTGIYWRGWRGHEVSLKASKMMIKPAE